MSRLKTIEKIVVILPIFGRFELTHKETIEKKIESRFEQSTDYRYDTLPERNDAWREHI